MGQANSVAALVLGDTKVLGGECDSLEALRRAVCTADAERRCACASALAAFLYPAGE